MRIAPTGSDGSRLEKLLLNLPPDKPREMLPRILTVRRFEEPASADYGVVHRYIGETDAVDRLRVEATGMIVPSPPKGQPFEMQVSALNVIGWVEDPDTYPIQPKPHTLEFLPTTATR
jgi:hypothetical protein